MRWSEKLPSVGFVAIVLTNAALMGFLVWGFQTPPLHRVWELHHSLKIGSLGKLGAKDHALLSAALRRHSRLARGLLSEGEDIGLVSANSFGWLETPDATIIRTGQARAACVMALQAKIPEEALPLQIEVAGSQWQRHLNISAQGITKVPLPDTNGSPEIITLRVTSKDSRDEVATLGLHVGFHCGTKTEGARHD